MAGNKDVNDPEWEDAKMEEMNIEANKIDIEETLGKKKRLGVRRRGPRRKYESKGKEYLESDNNCNIYPSWSTPESISIMRNYCKMSKDIEIIILHIGERLWHCPKWYVCLYESYFLKANIWFPLPGVLVSYSRARKIAISQLTTKAICHLVGLITVVSEVGVEMMTRFLEMICVIKGKKTFYVSTKPAYNVITHSSGDNINNWKRFYVFAKINE